MYLFIFIITQLIKNKLNGIKKKKKVPKTNSKILKCHQVFTTIKPMSLGHSQ